MRFAIVALAVVLLAPFAASAEKVQCRQYNQQITYFEAMIDRADAAGKSDWADLYDDKVDQIKHDREAECPGYGAAEQAAAQWREIMKLAAQGAITWFTMGAY